jgi:predicted nuclease of predicted toxin-antitoxin system
LIRALLDQRLPRSSTALLRAAGWDVVHAGDVGLAKATDIAILDWALAERRWVVTLDADFHRLLAISGASGPTVIRVREEGLTADVLVKLIVGAIARARNELTEGAVASAALGNVRIRALPIRRPEGPNPPTWQGTSGSAVARDSDTRERGAFTEVRSERRIPLLAAKTVWRRLQSRWNYRRNSRATTLERVAVAPAADVTRGKIQNGQAGAPSPAPRILRARSKICPSKRGGFAAIGESSAGADEGISFLPQSTRHWP